MKHISFFVIIVTSNNIKLLCEGFQVGPDANTKITVQKKVKLPELPTERKTTRRKKYPSLIDIYDDETYLLNSPSTLGYPFDTRSYKQISLLGQGYPNSTAGPTRKHLSGETCEEAADYWFNDKIHSFGNTGFFGMIHAVMAPFATWIIDQLAYDGKDVRTMISHYLHNRINKKDARVLDLCCGTGISTRALSNAFSDADIVVGLDTSPEMISMARFFGSRDKMASGIKNTFQNLNAKNEVVRFSRSEDDSAKLEYAKGNAERTIFPPRAFDLVTVMYGFHEAPRLGRYNILREAHRVLQTGGTLAIVDISPDYQPSKTMLAGEPYVLEYQKNIMKQLKSMPGFSDFEYHNVVNGHVGMWLLTRN